MNAKGVGGLKNGWRRRLHITSISAGENTMTSIPFILVLLITIMVPTASAQGGISDCCMKITGTKVPREYLKSYYKEDPSSCTQNAVVFTTFLGRRICASFHNLWTKTSMAYLDGKNWQKKQQQKALKEHQRRHWYLCFKHKGLIDRQMVLEFNQIQTLECTSAL